MHFHDVGPSCGETKGKQVPGSKNNRRSVCGSIRRNRMMMLVMCTSIAVAIKVCLLSSGLHRSCCCKVQSAPAWGHVACQGRVLRYFSCWKGPARRWISAIALLPCDRNKWVGGVGEPRACRWCAGGRRRRNRLRSAPRHVSVAPRTGQRAGANGL